MFKRHLTTTDYLLIAANLLPVYGVWFEGWKAVDVFIVYALETIIVGLFTVLKLGVMTVVRKKDTWYNGPVKTQQPGLLFMVFFIFHFGLFALVQTTIFSQTANIVPPGSGMMHFFFHWFDYINYDILLMLGAFISFYAMGDFIPFIWKGYYKTYSMTRVMFQPYGRIFIQQFTVILGSMFLAFGFGKGFILVFALFRIFFEIFVNIDDILAKATSKMEKESGKQ